MQSHRLNQEWMRRAACVDEDPELFFPVGHTGPALRDQAVAKEICGRCSVTSQCLDYALRSEQTNGVWGGAGEDERAPLHRAESRAKRRRRKAELAHTRP
jgi:WhiB family redox-sensing transcriptional regulator